MPSWESDLRIGRIVVQVAIVLAILAVVALGWMVVRGGRQAGDRSELARGFLEDVRMERYDSAYARMSGTYRAGVDPKRFREAVANSPYLRGNRSFRRRTSEYTGGMMRSIGTLQTDRGEVEAVFHFVEESEGTGKRWALSGVVLGGTPALPSAAGN